MASLQISEQYHSANIEYDNRVDSLLNAAELGALEEFLEHLEEFSKWACIAVETIRVSVATEEDAQIVAAIYVSAEAEKAMSFWKALENDTVKWLDGQEAQARGFLSDHVVTVVRW